jgi:ABC-type transport system involved in cytochrome c biogenesis ATPase subunit
MTLTSAPDGMLGAVVRAERLMVARRRTVLLTDLRLHVAAGELVHVVGPNGCGKSSLLRVLAGVVEPRRGRVWRGAPCAFVPERLSLPDGLRAARWLRVSGARGALLAAEVDRRCGELSKGELQKVALVGALHAARERPAVLVLDEPWAGLDASARAALDEELTAAADRGSAVIFTDHSRAATLRATRSLRLGGEPGAASPSRVRIGLGRGDEQATVVVHEPELAARLADGWAIRDGELLR